jgi:hypothetical protein
VFKFLIAVVDEFGYHLSHATAISMNKLVNAWLVTWEGTDSHIKDTTKIAGVLGGRCPYSHVEKVVGLLYQRTVFGVREMVYYANRRRELQARFKMIFSDGSRILYGSNPRILYARKVNDLKVSVDTVSGNEIVSWVERALLKCNASTGYKFVEAEPERRVCVFRSLNSPLSIKLDWLRVVFSKIWSYWRFTSEEYGYNKENANGWNGLFFRVFFSPLLVLGYKAIRFCWCARRGATWIWISCVLRLEIAYKAGYHRRKILPSHLANELDSGNSAANFSRKWITH